MRAFVTSFFLAIILLTVSKQADNLIDLQPGGDPTVHHLALAESAEGTPEAENSTELEDDDALNDFKHFSGSLVSYPKAALTGNQNFGDVVREVIPKPPRS